MRRDDDADGPDHVEPVRKSALATGQVIDDDARAPSLDGEGNDLGLTGAEIPFDDGLRK